jgi:hypothetical protein
VKEKEFLDLGNMIVYCSDPEEWEEGEKHNRAVDQPGEHASTAIDVDSVDLLTPRLPDPYRFVKINWRIT